LDAGGDSGAYALAFVRAKKEIRAAVFDLPQVIPLTRKYLKKDGCLGKIKTISGDYTVGGLGRGFDLVFLSAIIHSNSYAENRALMRKCAEALNPQGQVVVQDFIMEESRINPVFGAIFALSMLVATEAGGTYTESEVRAWMKEAGLSEIKRKDIDFGTTLIIGRKRKAMP
jgi:2-polyprenyl-3-methyl-5-hydroxy-6-metoxy-1,4-benzoquinol methylase